MFFMNADRQILNSDHIVHADQAYNSSSTGAIDQFVLYAYMSTGEKIPICYAEDPVLLEQEAHRILKIQYIAKDNLSKWQ